MDASKYYKDDGKGEKAKEEVEASPPVEHHAHAHEAHHEHVHAHKHGAHDKLSSLMSNKYVLIVLAILIFALAVYLRLGLVKNAGLFEPDGFFYYSVIRATINNHLVEPQYLGISGFPGHNFIGEAPGLPYLTVLFYIILGWTGLGYLTIMRFLPVLFALADMAVAYFLVKELSNSRQLGLLAMVFIAFSSGNIARTAALVYRGDSFIALPLMVALLMLVKGLKKDDDKSVAICAIIGAIVISTGVLIWNGSPFIIAIYLISIAFIVLYSFLRGDKALSRKAAIFAGALLATYLLQNVYLALHGARSGLPLEGTSFLIFYLPVLAAAIFTFYVTKSKLEIFQSRARRAIFAAVACIILIAVVLLAFPSYVTNIATAAGVAPQFQQSTNQTQNIIYAVGSTTQELQKPSYQFLVSSFGLELFLAPIGVVLFVLASGMVDGTKNKLGISSAAVVPAFIILATYLGVTSYLQYNAIRYNALVSIPIAIFGAYAVYAIVKLLWKTDFSRKPWAFIAVIVLLGISAFIIIKSYSMVRAGLATNDNAFIAASILIMASAIILLAHTLLLFFKGRKIDLRMLAVVLVCVILIYSIAYTTVESYSSSQADGINPQFLAAMTWMKANTPTNSTVLALWPDGSVVEAWANRTSYMDSVGGENTTRIYYFARFLANDTIDTSYLYSIGKPDYIVAREYWMVELEGLLSEGIPSNVNNYSYVLLYPTSIQHNATADFYLFSSQNYNVTLVEQQNGSATTYKAYAATGSGYAQIRRMLFYNTTSNLYTVVNSTDPQAVNYTFMVFFSGSEISGALLMTSSLYNSNLFKLVYLCNSEECTYNTNSSNVTLQSVYTNNDTRIFKVNYK